MFQRCLAQRVGKSRVIDGARQHECANHRGHRDERSFMRAWLTPVRRLTGHKVDHLLDAPRRCAPYLGCLARGFRAECCDSAASFDGFDMLFREIGPKHRRQYLLRWHCGGDARSYSHAFGAGTIDCLGEHRLSRSEVGIEPAVRQARLLHDVGDGRAIVAAAPNGARGGVDDALVRGCLASRCRTSHGVTNMIIIIYSSGPERKRKDIAIPARGCGDEALRSYVIGISYNDTYGGDEDHRALRPIPRGTRPVA